MKKLFSVLLSLFMLWGGVLISCSAGSESSGGGSSAPEALKLIICDSQGEAKESTDLTYNKAEGTGGHFYVKSNCEDLSAYKITGISLVRTSDDDDMDILSKVELLPREDYNGYKIIFAPAVPNAGNYKIIVRARKGSEKEVKITLNLTVEAGSVDPVENPTPVITKQPESVQWKVGEEAKTLTVEATISDGTISYQWYKDGNEINGATSASYTPDKTDGKGSYYVVVSNASDSNKSVTSSKVSVTIVAAEELLPPVINSDLAESASYDKVSKIEALSIKATATDGAEIYYKWYKDGNAIGEALTTASTYQPTGFGSYYCELYASKDGKNSQTINSKTIIISESDITVNVSVSPTSAYTNTELTASVTYNVESANVSYQWKKTDSNSGNDTEISGATSEKYTPTEAGRYYCRVTVTSTIDANNKVTTQSTPVNVSVKQLDAPVMPEINDINGKTSDFDLPVKEGGSFTLTVSASTKDGGELTYEWFKQGDPTPLETGTSYSKSNVTSSDAGKYYVRVTNTLNDKTASIDSLKVTVTIDSQEPDPVEPDPVKPVINNINEETSDFDLPVKEGGSFTLTVSASTTDDGTLSYEWFKQGDSNSLATGTSYSKSNVTTSDAGKYYVKVTNTLNGKTASAESLKVTVTIDPVLPDPVKPEPVKPVIKTINGNTASFTETVTEGGTLELTVVAASVSDGGTLSYAWYDSKSESPIGTEATYSKSNVTSSDAGEYYVTVTNTLNDKTSSTESFRVTVTIDTVEPDPEPVVPVIDNINEKNTDFELAVKEGGSFTLTVSASKTDDGTLSYKWFKQGDPTPLGTGTSYSKSNVATSDAGKYYVKVTNTLNGKTASAESLKVTVTITSNQNGSGSGGFDFN